jgi:hypothetical protein
MQEVDYEQLEEFFEYVEIEQSIDMHDRTIIHIYNAGTAESPFRYTVVASINERAFISPPFFIS